MFLIPRRDKWNKLLFAGLMLIVIGGLILMAIAWMQLQDLNARRERTSEPRTEIIQTQADSSSLLS